MGDFVFREASERDAGELAALIMQNYDVKSIEEAHAFFKKDLAGGMNYILAESAGKLAGFVTWKEHDRAYHELAELHAIAVDDSFKGKGLASDMFGALLEHAKGFYGQNNQSLRKLYVLTHATNERAIRFYKKMGFKKEVVLPSHYYKDVDELMLSMYF